MTRVTVLLQDLLHAAGVEPSAQMLDLPFLQCLYESDDQALHTLRDLITRTAELNSTFLTVDQVARRLIVKPKVVRRLAKWGALHGYQSRRGWVFTERALEEFTAQNTYCGDLRDADLAQWRMP